MTNVKWPHLRVWWLTSFDAERARGPLPLYITDELRSMDGRPKRQRLWVPPGLPKVSVSSVAEWSRDEFEDPDDTAGLVFLEADQPLVELANVGFVSDLDLKIVWRNGGMVL